MQYRYLHYAEPKMIVINPTNKRSQCIIFTFVLTHFAARLYIYKIVNKTYSCNVNNKSVQKLFAKLYF